MLVTLEPSHGSVARQMDSLKIDELRGELDGYFEMMAGFPDLDAAEVLMALSSFTARMSHVRSHLVRKHNKVIDAFRTKELDPFLKECDTQFKIWSRLILARGLEWEQSRGQK